MCRPYYGIPPIKIRIRQACISGVSMIFLISLLNCFFMFVYLCLCLCLYVHCIIQMTYMHLSFTPIHFCCVFKWLCSDLFPFSSANRNKKHFPFPSQEILLPVFLRCCERVDSLHGKPNSSGVFGSINNCWEELIAQSHQQIYRIPKC